MSVVDFNNKTITEAEIEHLTKADNISLNLDKLSRAQAYRLLKMIKSDPESNNPKVLSVVYNYD